MFFFCLIVYQITVNTSAILSSIFSLTTSFSTASLSLLKSTGTGTSLSISNLSTLYFKLDQLIFLANLDVLTSAAFFKSGFRGGPRTNMCVQQVSV